MAIRERKDGRWTVYYRARDGSGKIIEEYMGPGPAGEEKARRREAELALRRYKKPADQGGPVFEDIARAYTQNKNFSPNSKKHLKIRLEKNILPFFGDRAVTGLTHGDMNHYVTRRLGHGVKFSTIHREITDIKAILNWAARRHPPMIAINPVRDFENPAADDVVIYPPTRDEVRRILAAAPDHLKRAIVLAAHTGLRPGAVELLSLTWGAVNFDDRTIRILSAHKGGPARREVPLHPNLARCLADWRAVDEKLFAKSKILFHDVPLVHYRRRRIQKIQKSWAAAVKRAGITRRIRPYDLRHQFITNALAAGSDLKSVAEIVGSAPKTILQHYQHVSNELRRKTINQMGGILDGPGGPD